MKVFIALALCLGAAVALNMPFVSSDVMEKARCDMSQMHKCTMQFVGVS